MSLLESQALVVRTVEFGESDIIATLITEDAGKVGAVVRGARKGSRRVGGALEPVHTIAVLLEDKGAELTTLKESRIVRLRSGVVSSLDALEAAGAALRWARHLFPPRHPEPAGWAVLVDLLDELDVADIAPAAPRRELARAGLAMLAAVGYALELEQCAVCGRPCPEGRPACVDPARGGLVCRACGGAPSVLSPAHREAARALASGRSSEVTDAGAEAVLALVDRAMAAHAGFER
ncbi:MAG TPA: DNA repair protein RecO [Polyangiaceae bacterium]|nr:DNA repair protein RecO [Polyangiaceae bacterium]